jgi:hypothetical protein
MASGRVRVVGRWFGVRGRRFVRPALILTGDDGAERRLLAELDDKPWAAAEGESWRATFVAASPDALKRATRVELSVAPDVNVELRAGGATTEGLIAATGRAAHPEPLPDTPAPSDVQGPAASARTDVPGPVPERYSRARGAPPTGGQAPQHPPISPASAPRPRPAQSRAADLERLAARLRAAESALERERQSREEAERSLEREQSEARRLAAELARVEAELELARTAERAAADTAAELDSARRESHALRARHETLRSDYDRLLHAHAELKDRLAKRAAALEAAREDLAGARRAREEEAESRAAAAAGGGHRPPVLPGAAHNPPPPRTDRPLNPSLRQNGWVRLLVVLVLAGVLLAVYLVLHSTILH